MNTPDKQTPELIETEENQESAEALYELGLEYEGDFCYCGKVPEELGLDDEFYSHFYEEDLEDCEIRGDVFACICFWRSAQLGYAPAQYKLGEAFKRGCGIIPDSTMAIKWLTMAAEQGDKDAQYALGLEYEEGDLVEGNLATARYWLMEAAKQGNLQAEQHLKLMESGCTWEEKLLSELDCAPRRIYKDPSPNKSAFESLKALKSAAKRGNVNAQYELGEKYRKGDGVDENRKEAKNWYKKAAEHDHAESLCRLAQFYEEDNNWDGLKLAVMYEEAANAGSSEAAFSLGKLYSEDPVDVLYDNDLAIRWFEKVKGEHYAEAQYNLARLYIFCEPYQVDGEKALFHYKCSAQVGYVQAQCELGEFLLNGKAFDGFNRIIIPDAVEGIKWLKLAAINGCLNAQRSLAKLYDNGGAVKQNFTKSVAWYKKAIDMNDDASAKYHLGCAYEEGRGVEKNLSEAVNWFKKIPEDEWFGELWYKLGRAYEKGLGIEQDRNEARNHYFKAALEGYEQAIKWVSKFGTNEMLLNLGNTLTKSYFHADDVLAAKLFNKAADRGSVIAAYQLACIYKNSKSPIFNLTEAVIWFRKAAEEQHGSAQFELAEAYYNGQGVEKNLSEAVKWYKMAALQGNTDAQSRLLQAYYEGLVELLEMPEALDWFVSKADDNDVNAQYCVGRMFELGDGIETDLQKAVDYYTKASEQGDGKSQIRLASILDTDFGGDGSHVKVVSLYKNAAEQGNQQALESLIRIAEQGDVDLQLYLANFYKAGKFVKVDSLEVYKWYFKAAEAGNAQALFQLGLIYEKGKGVTADKTEAFNYFIKAAECGSSDAQFYLGKIYLKGDGVEKNCDEAIKYFKRAADTGHANALFALGEIYDSGEDGCYNHEESVKWYNRAAELGDIHLKYKVGAVLLQSKDRSTADSADAVRWLTEAANAGNPKANYALALAFEDGLGVQKDKTKAIAYYKAAAENGHVDAQYHYGQFLESQDNSDKQEVFEWYHKAATRNHVEALYRVGLAYETGEGVGKNPAEAIKWYRNAAGRGQAQAQYRLGLALEIHKSFRKDAGESRHWLQKAADQGNEDAIKKLQELS